MDRTTNPAIAVLCAVVLLAGCASGGPSELSSAPVDQARTTPVAAPMPDSVNIDAIEVAQTDDAARIEIQTSEALVWTTYRDEIGQLVVELPNSAPGDNVVDFEPATGLVSNINVSQEEAAGRPLTRLVIGTRQEADHSVIAADGGLRVELGSSDALAQVGSAPVQLAEVTEETMAEEVMVAEEMVEEVAEEVAEWTDESTETWDAAEADLNADEPVMAADSEIQETTVWDSGEATAPAEPAMDTVVAESWPTPPPPVESAYGGSATELRDIDVVKIDDSIVVRILGDGTFSYSTLSLEAPYRYVIDLEGVYNSAPRSSYSFGDEPVEKVRVAQFKDAPDAVSRVVVDLAYPVQPELVGLPDGLALSFGGQTTAAYESTTLWDDVSTAETDTATYEAPSQVYEDVPSTYETEAPVQVAYNAVQDDAPVIEEPAPYVAPATAEVAAQPVDIQFADQPERPDTELFNSAELPGSQKIYRGQPITLRLKDADVRDLLRSFSEFSGLNFVIQPGVRGTVTVELTDVPWDQALDLILKTNDLGYTLEGNILRIAPLSKLREEAEAEQNILRAKAEAVPLTTVIKRISYATAAQVATVLRSGNNSILSRRGTVIVDQRTNTLIIKELPNFIDTVIAVIETLDIPEPQVMIEARIVETTKRFSRTLGINWGFDAVASAATGNTTGLIFPNNGSVDGGVNLTQAGNGTLGISMGNVLNTFNLDIALQAAETDGLINILSAPKITTLNNESASIQSGLQIPIQTVSNNTVSVQFVNATLSLNVTPHVTAEGTVLMDINIQKREPLLAFAVAGASNAPISTKDARTRVIVRDGGTTVIGGIYEVTSDEGQDRVPGLAKVPLLKHLFKNNRQSEDNEELLIFITPRVVNL